MYHIGSSTTAEIDSKDNLAVVTAKMPEANTEIWHSQLPNWEGAFSELFFTVGFTQHTYILRKVKQPDKRKFYIALCAHGHLTVEGLKTSIRNDDYHHQGSLPNNFIAAINDPVHALKAVKTFKDEYLLDFINVEELGVRDIEDVDERIVENAIVHNVKNFIHLERILLLSEINFIWMHLAKINILICCF